jgi:hypothetical protein
LSHPDRIKSEFLNKTIRHVVTNDRFLVKDVIDTDKGVTIVIQSLRDEGPGAKHRIYTADLAVVRKYYEEDI